VSWARYDDNFDDHPKVMAALEEDPTSISLHVCANTYSHRNRLGGFVPKEYPRRLLGAKGAKAARALVTAGLWESCDGGWMFHDWADYAPASAAPDSGNGETLIDKRRRAGAMGGRKSGETRRQSSEARSTSEARASDVLPSGEASVKHPGPEPEPEPDVSNQVGSSSSQFADARAKHAAAEAPKHQTPSQAPQPVAAQYDPDPRPAVLVGASDELVAEYAAQFTHTLPSKFRQGLLSQCDTLFGEGFTRNQIRAGLIALSKKRDVGPGLLPSLVHGALSGPAPLTAISGGGRGRAMSAVERTTAILDAAEARLAAGGSLRQSGLWPHAVPDDNIIDGETA
jgi:hypothetical protein